MKNTRVNEKMKRGEGKYRIIHENKMSMKDVVSVFIFVSGEYEGIRREGVYNRMYELSRMEEKLFLNPVRKTLSNGDKEPENVS